MNPPDSARLILQAVPPALHVIRFLILSRDCELTFDREAIIIDDLPG
jgi:hypothetical protein